METMCQYKNRGAACIRMIMPAVCLFEFWDTCFTQSAGDDSAVVQMDTVEVAGELARNPAAGWSFGHGMACSRRDIGARTGGESRLNDLLYTHN